MLVRRVTTYVEELTGLCNNWGLRAEWAPPLLHRGLMFHCKYDDFPLLPPFGEVHMYSFNPSSPSSPAPMPTPFELRTEYMNRVTLWGAEVWEAHERRLQVELGWEKFDTKSSLGQHLDWLFQRICPDGRRGTGLTFGEIADREQMARPDRTLTDDAVRKAVTRLAKALGLGLPES
jgi:hypothetical protein